MQIHKTKLQRDVFKMKGKGLTMKLSKSGNVHFCMYDLSPKNESLH